MSGLKNEQNSFSTLTGPRNGSYTLGQVILARKLQSSCTTRTKSALTILRTASTWTRPTRH